MKKTKQPRSRKQVRKEQRKEKKAKRHQYYLSKNKKNNETEKIEKYQKVKKPENVKREIPNREKEQKREKILKKEMGKVRIKRLKMDNYEEDKNIKRLEKQLKLKKKKKLSVPKSFVEDGLDYLLEVCDPDKIQNVADGQKELSDLESNSDMDETISFEKTKVQKETKNNRKLDKMVKNDDEEDNDEDINDDDNDDEDNFNESEDVSEEEGESVDKEGEELDSDESFQNESDDESSNTKKRKKNEDGTWEDIYGRTRDKEGNVVQSYIPPHMRKAVTIGTQDQNRLIHLKRQLKGLLNRLAQSNVGNIANQIENLYMSNSRSDMNETLGLLVFDSLISSILTPERLIMEHCLLIATLHANVGTEVGAYFLQTICKKLNHFLNTEIAVEDKNIDNIIVILAYLYNFKIFHAILIFDLLNKCLNNLNEKNVDLILTILRTVGFTLRKDDPVALKTFIVNVQSKVNTGGTEGNSTRLKFMLDVLSAIKNNNVSKIPNYDPEHSENLKKLLKTLVRKGNYLTELKISLQDLLNAEEQGRWWVVGSAWSGAVPGNTENNPINSNTNTFSKKLLDLAKKQRMNTDARRNIFCILMSAEDYLDAFEKLLRLGLKGQAERDVINVLIHCCLQEKEFNPYYVHLAGKFCTYDRKFHMMLQYTIWDKMKQLDSMSDPQTSILSRFLARVILNKDLPLSVLKVIEFTELEKGSVKFIRQILLNILLDENEDNIKHCFNKITQAKQLKMFRESLRLFIHHFVLKKKKLLSENEIITLTDRVEIVDKILTADYRTIF